MLILLMMNSHFVLLDLPGTGVEVEVVDHGNGSKLLYWRGCIIHRSCSITSRVTSSEFHTTAVVYLNGQAFRSQDKHIPYNVLWPCIAVLVASDDAEVMEWTEIRTDRFIVGE